MPRINQDKFDGIIHDLMYDCPNINEANCDSCPTGCVLYRELCGQNIENTPDIMNTLRLLFLDELVLRTNAMRICPRFSEISPSEFKLIISNQNYFKLDMNNNLYAIY